MSGTDQQGSSLGSFPTFLSPLIGLRAFDLVSNLVWWVALANIAHFISLDQVCVLFIIFLCMRYILYVLSLRFFGLLSSSLLLFPQRFLRYVLRPSSDVCRTREPSRNFKLRPLLKTRGSPVLIPFAITRYKC